MDRVLGQQQRGVWAGVAGAAAAMTMLLVGCAETTRIEPARDAGSPEPDAGGGGGLIDASGTGGGGGHPGMPDAGMPPEPFQPCPDSWGPSATFTGTTPLGDFTGQYALMGWLGGECGGLTIAVSESPGIEHEFFATPDPPVLLFEEGTYDPMTQSYLGAGDTTVRFVTAAGQVESTGLVELTRIDPQPFEPFDETQWPVVEGTISVEGDGWSLSGSFTAPYCSWMDILCP